MTVSPVYPPNQWEREAFWGHVFAVRDMTVEELGKTEHKLDISRAEMIGHVLRNLLQNCAPAGNA